MRSLQPNFNHPHSPSQTSNQDLTFSEWCEIVDTYIRVGMINSCREEMGMNEIGDRPWAEYYEDGTDPYETVISEIADLDDPNFALIAF
jgi:hypothetical protein